MKRDRISRRTFLELGAAGAALGAVPVACAPASRPDPIRPTVTRPVVLDAAAPLLSPEAGFEQFSVRSRAARSAGVTACFVPVARREGLEATLRNLVVLREYCDRLTSEVGWVSMPDDLATVAAAGKLGIVPVLHGMQMIGEQLALLPALRLSGVASAQLTSGWKNAYVDGCFERSGTGLTGLGRMAIAALEDAHILVDLSGTGRKSSMEAAGLARRPVIFSHSNAAAVHPHAANLTDAQLDACAATGGVIGLTAFPAAVSDSATPTLDDFLRHLDHVVERVGVDHVGIGLGFDDRPLRRFDSDPLPDPPYRYPSGLETIAALPTLRSALQQRGYSPGEIEQILGGNFARVFMQTRPA